MQLSLHAHTVQLFEFEITLLFCFQSLKIASQRTSGGTGEQHGRVNQELPYANTSTPQELET